MNNVIPDYPIVKLPHSQFKVLFFRQRVDVSVDYSASLRLARDGVTAPKMAVAYLYLIPVSFVAIGVAAFFSTLWLLLVIIPICCFLFSKARNEAVRAVKARLFSNAKFYEEALQSGIIRVYALTEDAYAECLQLMLADLRQRAEEKSRTLYQKYLAEELLKEYEDEDVVDGDIYREDLDEYANDVIDDLSQTAWSIKYKDARDNDVIADLFDELIERCNESVLEVRTCRNMIIEVLNKGNGDLQTIAKELRLMFISLDNQSTDIDLDFHYQFTKDETDYNKYFEQGMVIAEKLITKSELDEKLAKTVPILLTYLATCCSTPELNYGTFAKNAADRCDAITGESHDKNGYAYNNKGNPVGFASMASSGEVILRRYFGVSERAALIKAQTIARVHPENSQEFNKGFKELVAFARENIGWRAINASK